MKKEEKSSNPSIVEQANQRTGRLNISRQSGVNRAIIGLDKNIIYYALDEEYPSFIHRLSS
jgi:hypothetical protein